MSARLRVRLVLNEGGEGVPLAQLSGVSEEAEKFLRYLASDAGISVQRPDWLARNFKNGSLNFDIEDTATHDVDEVKAFNHRFAHVAAVKAGREKLNGIVKHRTVLQFAKVADSLAAHEKLAFGLYRPNEETPFEWSPLTKREATDLKGRLLEEVSFKGTLQGSIHNIAVADLWFHLRDSRSEELVRCEFETKSYDEVIEAAHTRNARVYVRGSIVARRADRHVQRVKVARVVLAPTLSEERYQSFFGADPNYTGKMSTEEFIDEIRGYDH